MSFFFFKQNTAYELRISDWSSDVCSSDLRCSIVIPPIPPTKSPATSAPRPRTPSAAAAALPSRSHSRSAPPLPPHPARVASRRTDRKSVVQGKSVSVRVALGGRRILKKKNNTYLLLIQPSIRKPNI